MTAGKQIDKATINSDAGSIARATFAGFKAVAQFKAWLDGVTDGTLTGTYGFAQADVDDMRSAFGDLDQLRTIFEGSATLGSAKDFRAFSKRLLGDGLY